MTGGGSLPQVPVESSTQASWAPPTPHASRHTVKPPHPEVPHSCTMPACHYLGHLVGTLLLGLPLPLPLLWPQVSGAGRGLFQEGAEPGAPGGSWQRLSLSGDREMKIPGLEMGRPMKTKMRVSLVPKGGDPWTVGCEVQCAGGGETTES